MRKISFVATRPKKFKIGAWVIMKVLGTDYSHVCILFHSSKLNKAYPYEANGHAGVNFVGQDIWDERNQIVWQMTRTVDSDSYEDILDYSMGLCGIVYGTMQNIGIKVCDWIGIKYNPWSKGKNCSELVKLIAARMGINIPVDENRVTPRQAVDYLRTLEKVES